METKTDKYVQGGNCGYISPTPGRIPIIAYQPWVLRANEKWQYAPSNAFKRIKDAGFNVAQIYVPCLNILQDACNKANAVGVKCILQQYFNTDNIEMYGFVKGLADNSEIMGYSLSDEPTFEMIEQLNVEDSQNTRIGKVWIMYNMLKDFLEKRNESKFIYFNLAYSSDEKFVGAEIYNKYQGDDRKRYQAYLAYIQGQYKPSLWSYDVYPIKLKYPTGQTEQTKSRLYCIFTDQPLFYNALEDFSKISSESQRPFWTYCMSTSHLIYKMLDDNIRDGMQTYFPAPTAGNLRYEAFSALAFGAQGIVYWCYTQPPDNNSETYLTAPVNRTSARTDLWYKAREVNSEIAQFAPLFVECEVRSTACVEGLTFLSGNVAFSSLLNNCPLSSIVSENSKGLLISHVQNGGNDYLVLVSRDPFHEQEITINYIYNYLNSYNVVELTSNFLQEAALSAPGTTPLKKELTLVPGGYAIIRWQLK